MSPQLCYILKKTSNVLLGISVFGILGGGMFAIGMIAAGFAPTVVPAIGEFIGAPPNADFYEVVDLVAMIIAIILGIITVLFTFLTVYIMVFGIILFVIHRFACGKTENINWPPQFPFSLPPGLEGSGPIGILNFIANLINLTEDQRAKLSPDVLAFLECLRKCICKTLCKDGPSPIPDPDKNPGDVIINTGKSLLEDLNAQLATARQKLDEARVNLDFEAESYWSGKVVELTARIAAIS